MTTQRSLAPALALHQLDDARGSLEAARASIGTAVDHLDEPERSAAVGLRAEIGAAIRRIDSLVKFVRTAHQVAQ